MTHLPTTELLEYLTGVAHSPARPSWQCSYCTMPWPCQPVRTHLAEAYRSRQHHLAAGLAGLMVLAAHEVPHITPAQLYERFAAWVAPDSPPWSG